MAVKQLSVFLENKSGTLIKVLDILKQNSIQLIASTIADTADYGIFRFICNEPKKAYDALCGAGVAASLCDVMAINIEDRPGEACEVIRRFAAEGVSIAYLYSFLLEGKGVLIFRTDNMEKAEKIVKENSFHCLN